MALTEPSQLFRPGLLGGVTAMIAGPAPHEQDASARASEIATHTPASEIARVCAELGARVASCELPLGQACEQAALQTLARLASLDVLVIDAAGLFARDAAEQGSARAGLEGCMQASWELTHALAGEAFLEQGRPGRILYLAPDGGRDGDLALYACAARAGLENLARTLSIEFSRHSVTTVAIAPAATSDPGEIAALVAYLASPAGAYFSGCLLDLSGPAPASRASERAR